MENKKTNNMEEKELRIGNKVIFSEDSTVFTIQEIDNLGIGVINKKEQTRIELEYFKPIQLTEEILLKCGFEWSIFHQAIHKDGFDFYLNSSSFGGYYMSTFKRGIHISNDIDYLHQLQNLYFALTGKELEINL